MEEESVEVSHKNVEEENVSRLALPDKETVKLMTGVL